MLTRAKYAINRVPITAPEHYLGEGVESFHSQSDLLMADFETAYRSTVAAVGNDFGIPQRMRLLAWAGQQALAANPAACFVEFGTGRGFSMFFLLSYLAQHNLHPQLFMFDTFSADLPAEAKARGATSAGRDFYADSLAEVRERFSGFTGTELVVGSLPESLDRVSLPRVGLAHIDLNDGRAEVETLDRVWPNLESGALVVLDDFANRGRSAQRQEVQSFFKRLALPVLSTPQGQGLAIKP